MKKSEEREAILAEYKAAHKALHGVDPVIIQKVGWYYVNKAYTKAFRLAEFPYMSQQLRWRKKAGGDYGGKA